MSILETNKIDAIGTTKNEKGLIMMLSDHLTWEKEYEHLILLQEKINSYLEFWEERQYLEIYREKNFQYAVIEISFKYKMTNNCKKFLKVVQKQVKEKEIKIKVC